MISENPEEKVVVPESQPVPQVCGSCLFWQVMLVNQQTRQAVGPCTNKDNEDAPFGVLMAAFGSCEGWQLRPQQKIVTPPKGVMNRLSRL